MRKIALLAAAGLLCIGGTAVAGAPRVVGTASGKTSKLVVAGIKPIATVSSRATVAHPAALYVRVVASKPQKAEVILTISCDLGTATSEKVKTMKIATGRLVPAPAGMVLAGADSCFATFDSIIRNGGSETAQILAS